jgi:hypothetical protein
MKVIELFELQTQVALYNKSIGYLVIHQTPNQLPFASNNRNNSHLPSATLSYPFLHLDKLSGRVFDHLVALVIIPRDEL